MPGSPRSCGHSALGIASNAYSCSSEFVIAKHSYQSALNRLGTLQYSSNTPVSFWKLGQKSSSSSIFNLQNPTSLSILND